MVRASPRSNKVATATEVPGARSGRRQTFNKRAGAKSSRGRGGNRQANRKQVLEEDLSEEHAEELLEDSEADADRAASNILETLQMERLGEDMKGVKNETVEELKETASMHEDSILENAPASPSSSTHMPWNTLPKQSSHSDEKETSLTPLSDRQSTQIRSLSPEADTSSGSDLSEKEEDDCQTHEPNARDTPVESVETQSETRQEEEETQSEPLDGQEETELSGVQNAEINDEKCDDNMESLSDTQSVEEDVEQANKELDSNDEQENEPDVEINRKKAYETLCDIEIEFAKFRDILIKDKIEHLEREMELIESWTHQALKEGVERLEFVKETRLVHAKVVRDWTIKTCEARFHGDVFQANMDYLYKRTLKKRKMFEETHRKRWTLEGDKRSIDLGSAVDRVYSPVLDRATIQKRRKVLRVDPVEWKAFLPSDSFPSGFLSGISKSDLAEDLEALGLLRDKNARTKSQAPLMNEIPLEHQNGPPASQPPVLPPLPHPAYTRDHSLAPPTHYPKAPSMNFPSQPGPVYPPNLPLPAPGHQPSYPSYAHSSSSLSQSRTNSSSSISAPYPHYPQHPLPAPSVVYPVQTTRVTVFPEDRIKTPNGKWFYKNMRVRAMSPDGLVHDGILFGISEKEIEVLRLTDNRRVYFDIRDIADEIIILDSA